jgi:hypothetical protein
MNDRLLHTFFLINLDASMFMEQFDCGFTHGAYIECNKNLVFNSYILLMIQLEFSKLKTNNCAAIAIFLVSNTKKEILHSNVKNN